MYWFGKSVIDRLIFKVGITFTFQMENEPCFSPNVNTNANRLLNYRMKIRFPLQTFVMCNEYETAVVEKEKNS